ncbi:sulfotransferase family 2 domain-containing protein [Pacificoceanicola onchidii]|uniref:sulfotransferase family 2 domain-containing protein n=1 Tax=Pacificoceanicola onchidii TaxID=2562685 RepID=UPI0010A68976|nr:sulfotransferase family 2 domain-containing protein [Pacificoceanicola onchidii]
MIVIDAHKLAYAALPKAACSSVKKALAAVDPEASLSAEEARDVHSYHLLYPTARFHPRRTAGLEDHFRFAVVRDPLARLLSVWTNRVLEFGDLRNAWSLQSGRADLPMEPDVDFFFQNLDGYAQAVSSIKHHVLPARLFLGDDLDFYSQVYRTSELSGLAQDLSDWTRQGVSIPRSNRSATRLEAADLAGETLAAIRPRLDAEYDYLSRFYENPFG